jgi:aminoglycoside phosphotransferase (APT) family kinase protein
MNLMQRMLPKVNTYLAQTDWQTIPVLNQAHAQVTPLAQGEYNLNYLVQAGGYPMVFRVNIGTQINRNDQIMYEFKALELLKHRGLTPLPYYVDDSRTFFESGILIMEYLPGEPLDYARDTLSAAKLLAGIHQVKVPPALNHLIREDVPLSLIYEECTGLLQHYFDSDLADPAIRSYLLELKSWAKSARASEAYFLADPWHCIVNTEVNSGNFIVNRSSGSIHLVDWEMPRYGDPSQDLCHFCSPLTTLWKTSWRMSAEQKEAFLNAYAEQIQDRHLQDTLVDRIRLTDPFVYLRGISWSAMGWVAYQTQFNGMKNQDTWVKLNQYMDLKFIRSLFDPLMTA